jgi:NAD(P)-dependent dehydrogenase (short-subunit alcohol dehydrogenase family)
MDYFKDKIALVTGGASGMGRAVCEQMARHGAMLVVADIHHAGAQEVAESILAAGGQARAANLDVTQREDVYDLVNQTAQEHGRLDLIFNNAGIGILGDERDKTLDHWKKIIDVNLLGVLHGTTAAYPLMVKQGFGQIVNMASMAGYIPSPMDAAYGTTKHAVVGLSVSLRDEAADLGVKVNAVCPGFIKTPIIFNTPILNVDYSREDMEEDLPEFLFMEVNKAGTAILKGIARNRAMIVFPFHARLAWWMMRLYPPLFDRIGRLQIRSFRKRRIQGGGPK